MFFPHLTENPYRFLMSKQKKTFLSFTKGHFQSSKYSFDWKGTAFILKKNLRGSG